MWMLDNALDWAADIVQTMTGEKERRSLVEEYKHTYEDFKNSLELSIELINKKINEFNLTIRALNTFRKQTVGSNIVILGHFLAKFGNVKAIGDYTSEQESSELLVPERHLELKENYISEIDWSKEDVFLNSFFLSPIGMKIKTRNQNLSMREALGVFELEIRETANQLTLKEYSVNKDKELADIYFFCISTIASYINNVIIPELEIIEAFFQALKLKNEIVAEHKLENLCFSNDIMLLKNTPYEKHFLFVRNTFLFYVISCKIYNTPVLTNLISGNVSDSDIDTLTRNKEVLLEQKELVTNSIIFDRGR